MTRAAVLVVALVGCDRVLGLSSTTPADASDGPGPGIDAPPPCPPAPNFDGVYVAATNSGPFAFGGMILHPSRYLDRVMFGVLDLPDIYTAAVDGSGPVGLGLATPPNDYYDGVSASADGTEIWFERLNTTGGVITSDGTFHATLANGTWTTTPVTLDLANVKIEPGPLAVFRGSRRMVMSIGDAASSRHLYEATTTDGSSFNVVRQLGFSSDAANDVDPFVSPDGCWLLFATDRGQIDLGLAVATRSDIDGDFHVVGSIQTGVSAGGQLRGPNLAPTGTTLWFTVGSANELYVPN